MGLLEKTCTRCREAKPLDAVNFPLHNRTKSGFDSWCRPCRNEYRKEYRVPPGVRPDQQHRVVDARQLGSCIICGAIENIVVDHDHRTGRVRGALCQSCNMGLGHFKDNPELLELAAMYVRGECACGECEVSWGGRPEEPEYISAKTVKTAKDPNSRINKSLRAWSC